MEVRLYSFSKRNKSTKLVNVSFKSVDCQLKDRCTVENPLLLLDFEPTSYNYAYIPKWNRYYFISGWLYFNGLWEVNLTEDYLASYKSEILTTAAIISYASVNTFNIVDKRIPVTAEISASNINSATLPNTNWLTSGIGSPIISLTGKGTNGVYNINYAYIGELLDGVDSWWNNNVNDFFDAIKQLIYGGSAANCIKDAITICWTPATLGSAEDIYLGNYPAKDYNNNPIRGTKVAPISTDSTSIAIPWKYNDWRRSSPYSVIKLFLPLIGDMTISADEAKNDNQLDITYAFNNTSGEVNVKVVGHTSGIIFKTASGSGAAALHIGSSNTNVGKVTSAVGGGLAALVGGAATILSGGALAPAALGIGGGLAAAAGGTLEGLGGNTAGGGGLGGHAAIALGTSITCQVLSRNLSDMQINLYGRIGVPVFRNTYVGDFTGYVQTEGFQFMSSRASSTEKDMINQLLDSGIYVE